MLAASVVAFSWMTGAAHAVTATFTDPAAMTDDDRVALSTSGDGEGFLIGLNQTLGLLFDAPILTNAGDSLTVFTLPPASGVARARILIGAYNNGAPIFVRGRNVIAGGSRTINANASLRNGCRLLGGCDYIAIITTRTRRGAAGVEVDYVVVDGEVVEVASPTPEPTTWALMIVAFAGVAARMKTLRRKNAATEKRASARATAMRIPLLQATATRRTVHP